MKWAAKAKLEMYGNVDALERVMKIAIAISEHGLSGHGFSVNTEEGGSLGYWAGHGASALNRIELTQLSDGAKAQAVLMRSIEVTPDDSDSYDFKWVR